MTKIRLTLLSAALLPVVALAACDDKKKTEQAADDAAAYTDTVIVDETAPALDLDLPQPDAVENVIIEETTPAVEGVIVTDDVVITEGNGEVVIDETIQVIEETVDNAGNVVETVVEEIQLETVVPVETAPVEAAPVEAAPAETTAE